MWYHIELTYSAELNRYSLHNRKRNGFWTLLIVMIQTPQRKFLLMLTEILIKIISARHRLNKIV